MIGKAHVARVGKILGGKKKKRPRSLINTGGEDNYRTGEECVLSALIGGGTEQTLCSSNGILIIRSLSADQLKSGFTFPSFPICLWTNRAARGKYLKACNWLTAGTNAARS